MRNSKEKEGKKENKQEDNVGEVEEDEKGKGRKKNEEKE